MALALSASVSLFDSDLNSTEQVISVNVSENSYDLQFENVPYTKVIAQYDGRTFSYRANSAVQNCSNSKIRALSVGKDSHH